MSKVPFPVLQLAARKLFLDGRGQLNTNARRVAADLKSYCRVGKPQLPVDGEGRIDPIAVAVTAARRELWDRFVTILQLDAYTVANLRDDENA
jgi:hypothetical protein